MTQGFSWLQLYDKQEVHNVLNTHHLSKEDVWIQGTFRF